MSVQTVRLAGRNFVIVPEKDYRDLQAKAAARVNGNANGSANGRSAGRRMTAQDRGDVAEAKRREQESDRPYSQLRRELGLA